MNLNLKDYFKGKLKKKIWLAILPVVPYIIGGIFLIVILFSVLEPIMNAMEKIDEASSSVSSFFEKVGNLFTEGQFTSDKDAFFKKINKYHDNDQVGYYINYPLLFSTVFYPYDVSQFNGSALDVKDVDTSDPSNLSLVGKTMGIKYDYGQMESVLPELVNDMITATQTEYQCSAVNDNKGDLLYYDRILVGVTNEDINFDIDNMPSNGTCHSNGQKVYSYTYKEDDNKYKEGLKDYILKNTSLFKLNNNLTDDAKTKATNTIISDIFDRADLYKEIFENSTLSGGGCGGNCTYGIDGIKNGGNSPSTFKADISHLKVILMDGTCGKATGQEIDFETYILGVVSAEIGNASHTSDTNQTFSNQDLQIEAIKTEAVAARNYALTRATSMGKAGGLSLSEENGEWILRIRDGTEDQCYLDPSNIASDSIIRKAVNETLGEELLDADGNLVVTPYTSVQQNNWMREAATGMDYFEILVKEYSDRYNGLQLKESTCSKVCAASGDYTNWKQCDPQWGSTIIGTSPKTICDVGCLLTSISIQIARSSVSVNVNGEFNPGTLVQELNNESAFSPGSASARSDMFTKVAPDFIYSGTYTLSGTRENKIGKIKDLIDDDCYVVMQVKGGVEGFEHWVAIDYVENDNLYMMDPASNETNLWSKYPYTLTHDTTALCYKTKS